MRPWGFYGTGEAEIRRGSVDREQEWIMFDGVGLSDPYQTERTARSGMASAAVRRWLQAEKSFKGKLR